MTALSYNNMLTRLKRIVPSTTLDTELGDKLMEGMNLLVTLDEFPFQEAYQTATLAAAEYTMATPDNFGIIKDLVVWTADYQKRVERLDAITFDEWFSNPSDESTGTPGYYCIKVAEGQLWFNCPADVAYTIRIYFYKIPDDVTDTTVSQLTEMAKLAVIELAAWKGFKDLLGEHDTGESHYNDAGKLIKAMIRRYHLAREQDARFVSPNEIMRLRKGV